MNQNCHEIVYIFYVEMLENNNVLLEVGLHNLYASQKRVPLLGSCHHCKFESLWSYEASALWRRHDPTHRLIDHLQDWGIMVIGPFLKC